MQSLRPAAAARARPVPAAISASPVAAPAAAAAARHLARRQGRPLCCNYSSINNAACPTVSLRLGSAADAATLSLPLPPTAAKRLDAELRALHATLRAKQEAADAGERPKRWPAMDFAFPSADDDGVDSLAFQLYCNPNAHGSAFDAKVLVRVECGGGNGAASAPVVRMTGEARLTDVQGTLEAYWEEVAKGEE
jgi:hypothetical protein